MRTNLHSGNQKNWLFIGLAVIAVGIAVLIYNAATQAPDNTGTAQSQNQAPQNTSSPSASVPVKNFVVTGSNFSFDPAEIRVNRGDRVKITFRNVDGFHDFRLDEFNVATAQIAAGQEQTVEFVADKTGQFEYYCSVGQHRQMGMRGNLIVN